MEEIDKLIQLLAQNNCAPTININIVKDNNIDKYYAAAVPTKPTNHSRLQLFIPDEDKLSVFTADLSVCQSTADVCRAVEKLCGGKIASRYIDREFCEALLPHLKFESTIEGIYRAIYRKAA